MDITRLRTLRELTVRDTMGEVAQVLCLTPSAISQHVAYLEEATGLALVERNGRRVRLTAEGRLLASYAERAIAVLDEAAATMAALRGKVSGEVRVAAFSSIAAAVMSRTINATTRSHPEVRVVFEELESPAGMAALRAWKVDVAIVDDLTFRPQEAAQPIHLAPFVDDTLRVIVSKSHRLAGRAAVSLSELKDELWAVDLASHVYSTVVVGACRAAGFEPAVNAYSSNLDVIVSLVRGGSAISILPGLSLIERQQDICILKTTPEIRRQIFIACREAGRRHPAAAALIAQLQASAAFLPAVACS